MAFVMLTRKTQIKKKKGHVTVTLRFSMVSKPARVCWAVSSGPDGERLQVYKMLGLKVCRHLALESDRTLKKK